MDLEFHQLDLRYEQLRKRSQAREKRLLLPLAEVGQQTPTVVVRAPAVLKQEPSTAARALTGQADPVASLDVSDGDTYSARPEAQPLPWSQLTEDQQEAARRACGIPRAHLRAAVEAGP